MKRQGRRKGSLPALGLAAALTLGLAAPVRGAEEEAPWYAEAQALVTERGIMTGTDEGFAPYALATRATVFHVLWNWEGRPPAGGSAFADVAADAWYAPSAAWARQVGLATGNDFGAYEPDREVTRAELAVIFARYLLKCKGFEYPQTNVISTFTDLGPLPDWALDAMAVCTGYGLITGDGSGRLNSTATATRGELAVMLMKLVGLLERDQSQEEGPAAVDPGTAAPEDPDMDEEKAVDFVEGLLKELYLGQVDQKYLDLTGISRQTALDTYDSWLEAQTAGFFAWCQVTHPTTALRREAKELWGTALKQVKFEVVSSARERNGSFSVRLRVEPVDVMLRVISDWQNAMDPLLEEYPPEIQEAMSEAEYLAFDRTWGRAAVDLLKDKTPLTGNREAREFTVTLAKGADGRYSLSEEDVDRISELAVDYDYDPASPPIWTQDANGALVSLTRQSLLLTRKGEVFRLGVLGLPQDTSASVAWGSSEPRVAAVDSQGLVSAVGSGRCTITATVNGVTLNCTVECRLNGEN